MPSYNRNEAEIYFLVSRGRGEDWREKVWEILF
jgi:hypothetical protein